MAVRETQPRRLFVVKEAINDNYSDEVFLFYFLLLSLILHLPSPLSLMRAQKLTRDIICARSNLKFNNNNNWERVIDCGRAFC